MAHGDTTYDDLGIERSPEKDKVERSQKTDSQSTQLDPPANRVISRFNRLEAASQSAIA